MKYLIFFIATMFCLTAFCQFEDVSWAITQNGKTKYKRFTVDQEGNSYVLGKIETTTDLDPSANTFLVHAKEDRDVFFIKKVDHNGKS